jgi:hypothetical protein
VAGGAAPINVLCVKWGRKFGPEYVNRLRAMVARHLSLPHRFVCLTDDATGLHRDVECRAIPAADLHGSWNKLRLFHRDLDDLGGRALYLDLDTVVLRGLDPLVRYRPRDPFLSIRDWYRPYTWNSSVMRFDVGRWSRILDEFLDLRARGLMRPSEDPEEVGTPQRTQVFFDHRQSPPRRYPGDQEWVTGVVCPGGAHVRHTFPSRWIASWRKHCRKSGRRPWLARIVVFHGQPKPDEVDAAWVARAWSDAPHGGGRATDSAG